MNLTTGGLSITLKRLERAGYVTRRPDPEDRRGIWVETTELTRRLDDETFGPLSERLQRLVEEFREDELRAICDFLGRAAAAVAAASS